jgi:hypothetical protein
MDRTRIALKASGTALAALVFGAACCRAAELTRESVGRVKAATVFVQVTRAPLTSGKEVTSSGSGFFISSHGYVITCWHVLQPFIEGRSVPFPVPAPVTKIEVIRNSGRRTQRTLEAVVVAVDRETDLALLATGQNDAPFLRLSPEAEPYETMQVWAFGFPLGRAFSFIQRGPEITVSRGIVSALRHDDRDDLERIQIDAAVNPGNSGGPLVGADGTVEGVVNISYGATRLNFAIPVRAVRQLIARGPPDAPWQARGTYRVGSTPAGAAIFVDGKRLGETRPGGTDIEIACGMRQLTLVADGHDTWIRDLCLTGGGSTDAELAPRVPVELVGPGEETRAPGAAEAPAEPKLPPRGTVLLREGFERPELAESLDQSTGGTPRRTWYVDKGELHQHDSNGMLHAVFMGRPAWRDYAMGADVRINDEHDDSRAGLIFRSTDRGFYLFRIHRETDKAQLAYHSKSPFGWFILGERPLGVDIAGQTNRMEVCVARDRIACFLNDAVVFNVSDRMSSAGRTGFYSVESKASFDNLVVRELVGTIGGAAPRAGLRHFWFTDTFAPASAWWRSVGEDGRPQPWLHLDGAGVQPRADAGPIRAVMENYRFGQFQADVICSASAAAEDAESLVGVLFAARSDAVEPSDLRVEFSSREGRVCLVERTGRKSAVLAESTYAASIFGATARVLLEVRRDAVRCALNGVDVLRHEFPEDFELPRGSFGILTSRVKLAVSRLTVAGIRQE